MTTSRMKHLRNCLLEKNFHMALDAYELVVDEMSATKGFQRHDGSHFYFHLIDVTQKLLNFSIHDEEIITAALLHDLIEDVPSYTIALIQNRFNARVATIVSLLTKKEQINYKQKENLDSYLHAISKNYGASLVKTADRMHNFSTLRNASIKKRYQKAIETKESYIPFFKTCRSNHPEYASFFFEAKTQLEPMIWKDIDAYQHIVMLEERIKELERGQS